jgi:hypothetical protein
MALDVGSVFARAGLKLDDDGFNKWERLYRGVKRDAAKPIEADARLDVDERGFRKWNKGVDDADRSSARLRGSMGAAGGAARLAVGGIAAGGIAAGIAGKAFLEASSDIEEATAKNVTLFGQHSRIIDDFAASSAKTWGVSRREALASAGSFGALFKMMGQGRKEAAESGVKFTQLAADMASFNNASPEEALIALQAGLRGEAEPLRRFNVLLDDATLREEALRKGLIKTTKEALTPQEKAIAASGVIMRQTKEQQGDFARTSGSLANQTKQLAARFDDLKAAIGDRLRPVATNALKWVNGLFGGFDKGEGKVKGASRELGRVERIVDGVRGAFQSAFRFIGRVLEDNKDNIEDVRRTLSRFGGFVERVVNGVRDAFRRTFSGQGVGKDIRQIIDTLTDFGAWAARVFANITQRAIPGFLQAFEGIARVVRGVIRVVHGILTLNFGKTWDGVKDIFSGGVKAVGGILRAASAPFREAARTIGRAIGGAFSAAWDGVVSTARGFVNKIIDVINIIPGVNIGHVGGGGSSAPPRPGGGRAGAEAAVAFRASGGLVDAPIVVMGEDAPDYPEWVIPTNPRYRNRARSLLAKAAESIGEGAEPPSVSARSSAIRDTAGKVLGGIGDAAGAVGGAVKGAAGSVLDLALKGPRWLIDKLPKPPGGVIGGAFEWAKDRAIDFIKDKVSDLVPSGAGVGKGTNILANALARKFGLSISSGYRSPARNRAAGGAPNSSHMRGSPSNPGAHDFVPPSEEAKRAAYALGAKWADIHDYGSGLHLHVSWFAAGGRNRRRTPKFNLSGKSRGAKENRGILRSVKRGERGIRGFEDQIQRAERVYSQKDREYGLDDEALGDYLIEYDDGRVEVNENAIRDREAELEAQIGRRGNIGATVRKYREKVDAARKALTAAINRVTRALNAAKGAARGKERAGYAARIRAWKERRAELGGIYSDLGGDLEDNRLDLEELGNELKALGGKEGRGGAKGADAGAASIFDLGDPMQKGDDQEGASSGGSGTGGAAGEVSPDLAAILDRERELRAGAEARALNAEQWLGVFGSSGDIGQGSHNAYAASLLGGGQAPSQIVFSSVVPPTPAQVREAAAVVTTGLSYQSYRPSTTEVVG